MKLSKFLKGKLLFVQSIMVIVFVSLLRMLNIGDFAFMIYCMILFTVFLMNLAVVAYEFVQKNRFYKNAYEMLATMEEKQYLGQMIEYPDFEEGVILVDILRQSTKAMNDEINRYKTEQEEYREYIETWIHEVKIPISCISLICENNKDEVTRSITEEVSRIDNFVEQTLYYAKSTNIEKDYAVRGIELDSFVKAVIKKHSRQLIGNKAEIRLEELHFKVFSDPKWLDFILGQLISNSIKYKKEKLKLTISAEEKAQQVILSVKDNGIGIQPKDLPRIFEKGFTGDNGRLFGKSTGIGLYLCKKLCEKMRLGLEVKSEYGEGTTIMIIFPKDKSLLFET
ncbi:MAG: sensor histidine kinase [Proteocatella sp.]